MDASILVSSLSGATFDSISWAGDQFSLASEVPAMSSTSPISSSCNSTSPSSSTGDISLMMSPTKLSTPLPVSSPSPTLQMQYLPSSPSPLRSSRSPPGNYGNFMLPNNVSMNVAANHFMRNNGGYMSDASADSLSLSDSAFDSDTGYDTPTTFSNPNSMPGSPAMGQRSLGNMAGFALNNGGGFPVDPEHLRQQQVQELRRQIHIASEQKRRAMIKDGFAELENEIPDAKGKKWSKAQKLMKGVEYIQFLKRQHQELLHQIERLRDENARMKMECAGYRDFSSTIHLQESNQSFSAGM